MKKLTSVLLASSLLMTVVPMSHKEAKAETKYDLTSRSVSSKIKSSTLAPNGLKIGKQLKDYQSKNGFEFIKSSVSSYIPATNNKNIIDAVRYTKGGTGFADLQEKVAFNKKVIKRVELANYKATTQSKIRKIYKTPVLSTVSTSYMGGVDIIQDHYQFGTFIYMKNNKQLIMVQLTKFKSKSDVRKFSHVLKTHEFYPTIKKKEWK